MSFYINEWISELSSENLSYNNYIQTDKYLETSLSSCVYQFILKFSCAWIEVFAFHKPAKLSLLNKTFSFNQHAQLCVLTNIFDFYQSVRKPLFYHQHVLSACLSKHFFSVAYTFMLTDHSLIFLHNNTYWSQSLLFISPNLSLLSICLYSYTYRTMFLISISLYNCAYFWKPLFSTITFYLLTC